MLFIDLMILIGGLILVNYAMGGYGYVSSEQESNTSESATKSVVHFPSIETFGIQCVYTGELNDSHQASGHGKAQCDLGWQYDGQFEDNVAHGQGFLMSPVGEIYEGSFSKGLRHGKATIYS